MKLNRHKAANYFQTQFCVDASIKIKRKNPCPIFCIHRMKEMRYLFRFPDNFLTFSMTRLSQCYIANNSCQRGNMALSSIDRPNLEFSIRVTGLHVHIFLMIYEMLRMIAITGHIMSYYSVRVIAFPCNKL